MTQVTPVQRHRAEFFYEGDVGDEQRAILSPVKVHVEGVQVSIDAIGLFRGEKVAVTEGLDCLVRVWVDRKPQSSIGLPACCFLALNSGVKLDTSQVTVFGPPQIEVTTKKGLRFTASISGVAILIQQRAETSADETSAKR